MRNETLALVSYGWTRYQRLAKIIFAVTAASLALCGLAWAFDFPRLVALLFGQCALLGLFGCFCLPIGLFSMSHRGSMLNAHTGYDAWLLRLPIPSWKLAIVPALLVTASFAVLWLMIAVPARIWGDAPMPILSQVLAMSSGAIVVFSLIWKPQRFVWLRGAAFIFAVPYAYISAFGCIGVAMEAPEFMPLVVIASVVCYAASLAFAIYSIKLARVSAFQQSRSVKSVFASHSKRASKSTVFKSRDSALAWYDTHRAKRNLLVWTAVFIPTISFCTCVLPLQGVTAIFGLICVSAICCHFASMQMEPTVTGDRSSLPSYLLASPLASRELAYSRLRSVSTSFVCLFALISLFLLISLLVKNNLATAERWWTDMQAALSTSAPVRIILFTYAVTIVVSLGLLLRLVSVQMYGRQHVILWLTFVTLFAIAAPLIVFLSWFLKQTNWEHVTLVTTSWLNWSYNLIYVALAIKICVDLFVVLRVDRRLVSQHGIMRFVVGWSVIVIVAAVTAWMVWPASSFTFITALMVTVIAIPLSPFLLAPGAVDANRHRSVRLAKIR